MSLFAVSGCAVNPVTGKKELALYSTEDEIAIGREHYFTAQQSSGGLYKVDTALTGYVARVGRRIAAVSDRPLPYEFVVLNDSSPNAWALPGGKIGINRGLLVELDNEAELAAVLGHEIVHAAARHGAHAKGLHLIMEGAMLSHGQLDFVGIAQNLSPFLRAASSRRGMNGSSAACCAGACACRRSASRMWSSMVSMSG